MYKDKCGNISIAFTGDVMLSKRLPKFFPLKLEGVKRILLQYDCRIGNLETTIHRFDEG